MKKRVLLVDDEPRVRASLKTVLEPTYEVFEAADAAEGLRMFKHDAPDLVLLDVILPGADGLSALQTMRTENRAVPVIMLTGTKSVKTAVDAMKLGAADYLSKPFDVEELQIVIERTLGKQELEQEVRQLRAQVVQTLRLSQSDRKKPGHAGDLRKDRTSGRQSHDRLGHGRERNRKRISGQGHSLQQLPPRSPVRGAELRGLAGDAHRKRTLRPREGLVYRCHGQTGGGSSNWRIPARCSSTKSEISARPHKPSSLRVLQEREFTRVGGVQSIKVDVRIVAATNKNLDDMVRKNQFREDLYYRINVIALYLPPLRERGEDIALLAKHFLAKRIEEEKRPSQEFTKDALELISHYPWPGNVREMENIIEQAFIWSKGSPVITPRAFAEYPPHRYTLKLASRRHACRAHVVGEGRDGIRTRNYSGRPQANHLRADPCGHHAGHQPTHVEISHGHLGNQSA
jgi:two-component system response regulator AtoC